MMTLKNSTLVLTSQFPHTSNSDSSRDGPNTKFTFGQTFQAEGRNPDSVYTVDITDDEAFWHEVDRQTNMPKWNWNPDNKGLTQCSIAAWNAIAAGGVEGSNLTPETGTTMTGTIGDRLRKMANKPDGKVRETTGIRPQNQTPTRAPTTNPGLVPQLRRLGY